MSREVWSQPGEPTWAIDERLRRLEARVDQLAAVVADLVSQEAARGLAAPDPADARPDPADARPDPADTRPDPADARPDPADTRPDPAAEELPALETVPAGSRVASGSSGRAAGAGQPCQSSLARGDGGSRGGAR